MQQGCDSPLRRVSCVLLSEFNGSAVVIALPIDGGRTARADAVGAELVERALVAWERLEGGLRAAVIHPGETFKGARCYTQTRKLRNYPSQGTFFIQYTDISGR